MLSKIYPDPLKDMTTAIFLVLHDLHSTPQFCPNQKKLTKNSEYYVKEYVYLVSPLSLESCVLRTDTDRHPTKVPILSTTTAVPNKNCLNTMRTRTVID